MQINCLHPLTILNPSLMEIIRDAQVLLVGHESRYITNSQRFDVLDGKSVYRVFNLFPVNRNSAPPAIELIDSDGVSSSLFVQVPCGHCHACLKSKHFSLVQRAEMAFQESKTPCYFVTLTYSPRWNYFIKQGVQLRHVQLFKKRFKRNIELYLHDSKLSESVRFLVTSEYGKLGRPHYHMLLFGCPLFDKNPVRHDYLFRQFVNFCWRSTERNSDGRYVSFAQYLNRFPKLYKRADDYDKLSYGFTQISEIKGDTKSCASYACKYAIKSDSVVPKGKNKLFRSVSHNLGFDFVLSKRDSILMDKNSKFCYNDWRSNSLVETYLSKYYVGKVFPSRSKLIPVDFRNLLRECEVRMSYILANSKFISRPVCAEILRLKLYFLEHFPMFDYFDCVPDDELGKYKVFTYLDSDLKFIKNSFFEINKYVEFPFDDVDSLCKDRDIYLSKFKERSLESLSVNSRRWHRDLKNSQSLAYL